MTRRKTQKSGMAKALDTVGRALPTGKTAKAAPGGAKGATAGLAMLAGVAGLALKNRDKIEGMLRRKGDDDRTAHADAPARPVVVTEPGTPDAATTPATGAGLAGTPGADAGLAGAAGADVGLGAPLTDAGLAGTPEAAAHRTDADTAAGRTEPPAGPPA